MRKLNLTATLYILRCITLIALFVIIRILDVTAQCPSSEISGYAYLDVNNNGIYDSDEEAIPNLLVQIADNNGIINQSSSASNGAYSFSGLNDTENYKLIFNLPAGYTNSWIGPDNGSNIQFVSAPSCDVSLGLLGPNGMCSSNPEIFVACFVEGRLGENSDVETIVGMDYGFTTTSSVKKYASKSETGSIWGMGWRNSTNDIFSAAFIKQYAGLTSAGHDAIFRTNLDGANPVTQTFIKLSDLNVDAGTLSVTDVYDCAYGDQVGKVGLGALAFSPDESHLYVTNLHKKTVVKIDVDNPTPGTTAEIAVPNPNCVGGSYQVFALKVYKDKLYVGVTCTADGIKNQAQSVAHVYSMDLATNAFNLEFSTDFIKGYWDDTLPSSLEITHWLTDIDFTDDGNMVIALTDRKGHRYCNPISPRLDIQRPDLLMVWNDNGVWRLESNGKAGNLTGTGVSNGEGPNNGEFFGDDFWIANPTYHPEIALGSIVALPGSNNIVSAVFDPMQNSYSGGLHRYSTRNGDKLSAIELYSHTITPQFGKATGFGDLVIKCGPAEIEIGNFVWEDKNCNGLQDAGESPIAGLDIYLYDQDLNPIAFTTTDANGNYTFNSNSAPCPTCSSAQGNMGVAANTTYYVGIDPAVYNAAGFSFTIAGASYVSAAYDDTDNTQNSDQQLLTLNGNTSYLVEVNTGSAGSVDHNFDIGIKLPENYDLALSKVLASSATPRLDEIVDFEITVTNEGGLIANKFTISDNIADGFTFDPSLNPGWNLAGAIASYNDDTPLLSGQSRNYIIRLGIIAGTQYDYVNIAQITASEDQLGETDSDIDSSPNNDDLAEDDIDQAQVKILDLALKNELVAPNAIYSANNNVTFEMTIYNQGTTISENIEVVNYRDPDLIFNPGNNTGWTYNGTNYVYSGVPNLDPGQNTTIRIVYTIRGDKTEGSIINYAEILSAGALDCPGAVDFDSTPDDDRSNDAGGEVETPTDNDILDHGTLDEDDQDPAIVRLQFVDLALKKTTPKQNVSPGDLVDYTITIYNQGSISVNEIMVIDYLPQFTSLADNSWAVEPSDANGRTVYKRVTFENGLLPGNSYNLTITLRVDDDVEPQIFVNYAEIGSVLDMDGNDISDSDIDSQPDMSPTNDNGGVPNSNTDNLVDNDGTEDEDDHDPATVYLVDIEIEGSCNCLNNATNDEDGQFTSNLVITAPSGQIWHIIEDVDIFDPAFPAPAPLTPFTTGSGGVLLTETVGPGGLSEYNIEVLHVDGEDFFVRFMNNNSDVYEIESPGCEYIHPNIMGDMAVCENAESTYSVSDEAGCTYSWTLTGDGVITSGAGTDGITVQWGTTPGDYTIAVEKECVGECISPVEKIVSLGTTGGSISCVGEINTSLGNDCELVVSPSMLLAGNGSPNAAYSVMLTDPFGVVLPNATITGDNLGVPITAKLIDACSGNSCWGVITVEDKLAPQIDCSDAVVACHNMDSYLPIVHENCGTYTLIPTGETVNLLTCDSLYIKEVFRTYKAVDQYGNESPECTQRISVLRFQFDSIATDFVDYFDAANWTFTPEGDGSVDITNAPESITITGGNNGVLDPDAGSDFCIVIPDDGFLRFTWDYSSNNTDSFWDPFGYSVDGVFVQLTDDAGGLTQTGSAVISVQAGQTFCFSQDTEDGVQGSASTEILDFVYQPNNHLSFPSSFLLSDMTNLVCGDFLMDETGAPDVSVTGVPMMGDTPFFPATNVYCNVGVDYEDNFIPTIGCSQKLVRTWTVYESWCTTGVLKKYTQTIEISDDTDPVITCPASFTVTSSGLTCDANITIPPVVVDDECSLPVEVDVMYPGGFLNNQNGGSINNDTGQPIKLEPGDHIITYTVYDACDNSSQCSITITVEDNTTPVAICNTRTVVSLRSDGTANVYALTFDDGSYDECYIDSMAVRRMDGGAACGFNNDVFGPSVPFCCADVGTEVMVQLGVWDKSGNMNSCMVIVEVQDKFGPEISCPDDVTIFCEDVYDLDDLSQYGTATFADGCGATLTETSSATVNSCNTGFIRRIFTATDGVNSVSCMQTIFIENPNPFNPATDIQWPEDYEVNTCNLTELEPEDLPEENGFPVIDEDFCDMASATHSDHLFVIEDGDNACFKILRTWTVIDWCNPDADATIYEQIIKVFNTVVPELTGSCDPLEMCTFDDNCEDGAITLMMTATDDCTSAGNLRWEYAIDIDTDGTIDFTDSQVGEVADASGTYPIGNHTILWTFEDMCGNETSCLQEFSIINCKAPTAVCQNLSTTLQCMDLDDDGVIDTEMVCIWASDLNASSSHPCGYDVTFSFSADTSDTKLILGCEDLGANEVTLWVTDENGMTSTCVSIITVADNENCDLCVNFDLALAKTYNAAATAQPIAFGSDVVFDIMVCNQGDANIVDVEVTDYIPSGFTLNDGDWTSGNAGSTGVSASINLVNDGSIIPVAGIIPGNCVTVPITLTLNPGAAVSDLINYAEITGGTDAMGNTADEDIDSTPGSDNTDENSVMPGDADDDNINGGGPGENQDEDDHDPATIPVFDLALTKVVMTPGPYTAGDIVTFQIEVFNQGNIAATDVELIDYIPCGLLFGQNPAWNLDAASNTASTTIPGPIAPGTSTTVLINLAVQACIQPDGYVNFAEISAADDGAGNPANDIDSTPDTTNGNDAGGEPNGASDDMVIGDGSGPVGTGPATTDEDDHDPAIIDIFDLAIMKTVVSTGPFEIGDPVTFRIRVINQGNVTAQDIDIVDYIQTCGFSFTAADNPDWDYDAATMIAATEIAGPLAPGAQSTVDITLTILDCDTDMYTNFAEISGADDDNGNEGVDIDSTPDEMNDDPTVDDEIDNGGGDEDDHDIAVIDVCDLVIADAGPFCTDDAIVTLVATPVGGTWSGTGIVDAAAGTFDPGLAGVGTFAITYAVDGCDETISITVETPPVLITTDPEDVCNSDATGEATTVDFTGLVNNLTGTWADTDGSGVDLMNLAAVDFDGVTPGTYTFTYTIAVDAPCDDVVGTITVMVLDCLCPMIMVEISGDDICIGESTDLTTTVTGPTVTFLWSTMETTATITVAPMVTTTYSVTVTDVENPECSSMDMITINVNPLPACMAGSNSPVCEGETIMLTENGGDAVAWMWTGPDGFTSTDQNPSITMVDTDNGGTYTVITTSADGCIDSCTTVVEVQAIELTCSTQDITVHLDGTGQVTIQPEDVDNGSSAGCGDTVELSLDRNQFFCNDVGQDSVKLIVESSNGDSICCFALVTILDTIAPVIINCPADTLLDCFAAIDDLSLYGTIGLNDIADNCPSMTMDENVVSDIDECNLGTITRTFIVTDASGNIDSCTQVITISGMGNALTEDDITWPMDTIIIEDCSSLDPDSLNSFPILDISEVCGGVSIDFMDIGDDPTSCMDTITRVWTVIDSCADLTFMFNQTIFYVDTLAPLLVCPPDPMVEDPECDDEFVSYVALATDCSDIVAVTNNSPFADAGPNSLDLSGTYPAGVYLISITAEDVCGNIAIDTCMITVADTMGIQFRCNKVITDLDDDAQLELPADLFNPVALTCGEDLEFTSSFDLNDPTVDTLIADCDDLGETEFFMYFFVDGVFIDSCFAILSLFDPLGVCGNGNTNGDITGRIFTEEDLYVGNVEVDLDGSSSPMSMTGDNGRYAFMDMPYGGAYNVDPHKDVQPMNGVSTLDLIYIQRHVLGLQALDSPYKIIAADINHSETVTVADLVELRKLILGIYDTFPANESWRMVDADYEFVDPYNPLDYNFPESYNISDFTSNMVIDFVGVKIGDVNNSAKANAQATELVEFRTSESLDIVASKFSNTEITFGVDVIENLQGFQFTLDYDANEVTVASVEAATEYMGGFAYNIGEDFVTVSWVSDKPMDDTYIDDFFTVKMSYNSASSMPLEMSSSVTAAEAYVDFNIADVTLRTLEEEVDKFQLIQNKPNPWSDKTNLEFYLPQTGACTITVFDMNGRNLYNKSATFEKGLNTITLSSNEIDGSGVLYYQLQAGEQVLNKRMILIK